MAEHTDPNGRQDEKLSAKYATMYIAENQDPLKTVLPSTCDNCHAPIFVALEDTDKLPLCKVCWATLQTSIKIASRRGFHFGAFGQ